MSRLRYPAAVIVLLALTGCLQVRDEPSPAKPASTPEASVRWENYPPNAQQIIDEDEAAGNCTNLVAMFDNYYEANASYQETTGYGTSDLLEYIDAAMKSADCY